MPAMRRGWFLKAGPIFPSDCYLEHEFCLSAESLFKVVTVPTGIQGLQFRPSLCHEMWGFRQNPHVYLGSFYSPLMTDTESFQTAKALRRLGGPQLGTLPGLQCSNSLGNNAHSQGCSDIKKFNQWEWYMVKCSLNGSWDLFHFSF